MAGASKTDLIKQLTEGVAALTTTQEWERWLRAQRTFYHYSFGNTLLILRQFPEATQVAGFHSWRHLGRSVRKGEQGIAILAPVMRPQPEDDDDDDLSPVAFRIAYVFDVSQTEGEPLPEIAHRLDGDDPASASVLLEKVAAELGYSVTVTQLPGERNGDCAPELRRIRVSDRLAPAHQVKTLAHELAHAILHDGEVQDRGLEELEAESVAYIVCHELDLDSSAYSFGYLAVWGRGGDKATRAITASGQRITAAARQILDRLDARGRPQRPPGGLRPPGDEYHPVSLETGLSGPLRASDLSFLACLRCFGLASGVDRRLSGSRASRGRRHVYSCDPACLHRAGSVRRSSRASRSFVR